MDGSIFIVGESPFLEQLSSLIADYGWAKPSAASDVTAALTAVQTHLPDVVLIQAESANNLELCRLLKAQNHLAWIYLIAVMPACRVHEQGALLAQLEQEAWALEAGADAAVWWLEPDIDEATATLLRSPTLIPIAPVVPYGEHEASPPAQSAAAHAATQLSRADVERLQQVFAARLKTQLQVGIRRVQQDRELMQQNNLLSAIALSDPLTELSNRRAFEWELPRKIQNARHHEAPLSLLVLDVDYFKSINDNYGHLAGDRALQLLSARLRHHLRLCDTIFRYGGEEFVVILSDTGADKAVQVGQRLRHRMAEKPFVLSDTLDVQITISVGSASLLPSDDAQGTRLLNRADRCLLLAKSRGRNQVISSEELSRL